eukprot:CAMPEP_0119476926 /NCGR_PEP_ID=MMETSP1344-20130328/7260_1 /TAXON_ID=236787 /ORGANISM="Florenciella parvula, Strain CCMP2471" /LENGTH=92 /DNA_ID=CAMNT_0007510797 /DNA_START=641 /DNA_END=916 /DNA_ORIENTATION=+
MVRGAWVVRDGTPLALIDRSHAYLTTHHTTPHHTTLHYTTPHHTTPHHTTPHHTTLHHTTHRTSPHQSVLDVDSLSDDEWTSRFLDATSHID